MSIVIVNQDRGMIQVHAQYHYESALLAIRNEIPDAVGDYKTIRVEHRDKDTLIGLLLKHSLDIQDHENVLGLPPFFDGDYAEIDLADTVTRLAGYHDIGRGADYDSTVTKQRKELWGRAQAELELLDVSYKEDYRYGVPTVSLTQISASDSLVRRLTQALSDATRATFGPRGLVEELTVAEAVAAWESTRLAVCGVPPTKIGQKAYPTRATTMVAIAAALASTTGPAPVIVDGVIRRVYGAWPISIATDVGVTFVEDARVDLVSWAVLTENGRGEDVLMHISAVNSYQKNKALWAGIMDGTRAHYQVSYPHHAKGGHGERTQTARRQQGKKRYVTDWNDASLKISRLSHISITHYTAEQPVSGQNFLHLVGDHATAAPDLPWFYQQLDTALTVPLREEWTRLLWEMGVQLRCIHRMPSFNCAAYWVEASEARWTRIVQALTLGKTINDLGDVDVITIGGAVADADQLVLEDVDDNETEEEDD